MARQHTP
ncbi:hypothetical protein CP02DC21_1490A, partial [Chlamydia psittaci 02DC21]